jgi:hypothetical protein
LKTAGGVIWSGEIPGGLSYNSMKVYVDAVVESHSKIAVVLQAQANGLIFP